jgi:hypothetical protein
MWIQSRDHANPYVGIDDPYTWYIDTFPGTPPNSGTFHLLAFGGTNVQAFAGSIGALGTGSTVVTGVGFQPDVVIFFSNRLRNHNRSTGEGYWPHETYGSYPDGELYWGAADSAGNQWAGGCWSLFYYAWYRWGYWNESACFGVGDPTGFSGHTQVPAACTLVSMDTDGFTLNHDAGLNGWPNLHYMAMKSSTCQMKVGVFEQALTTGNQDITGLGFNPAALWLSSTFKTSSSNAWQEDFFVHQALLAADGGQMQSSFGYLGGNRYNAACTHSPNQTIWTLDHTALKGKATGSLITDGFRLNWTTSDGQPRKHGYVAWEADQSFDSTRPKALINAVASGKPEVESVVPYGKGSISLGVASAPFSGFSAGCVLCDGSFWSADLSQSQSTDHAIMRASPTFPWVLGDLWVPSVVTPTVPQLQQYYRFK